MQLKKGAKVYAVAASGSYNEEMKLLGIQLDEKIDDYYKEGGVINGAKNSPKSRVRNKESKDRKQNRQ